MKIGTDTQNWFRVIMPILIITENPLPTVSKKILNYEGKHTYIHYLIQIRQILNYILCSSSCDLLVV